MRPAPSLPPSSKVEWRVLTCDGAISASRQEGASGQHPLPVQKGQERALRGLASILSLLPQHFEAIEWILLNAFQ